MFKIRIYFKSNAKNIYTIHEETATSDQVLYKLDRMVNQWYDNICTIDFERFKLKYSNQYDSVVDVFRIKSSFQNINMSSSLIDQIILKCYLINVQIDILNNLEMQKHQDDNYINRKFDIEITEIEN
jgi:hypothetical protein